MSVATEHASTGTDDAHVAGGSHDHPSDLRYIGIAIVLAVLTAFEISIEYIDFGAASTPLLIFLMIAKFALVVLYFMHLKFDSPLFRRMFVIGLLLAIAVYVAMLCAFEVFA